MAKNWIERGELVGKLMETIGSAEDPLRAMAEGMMDYLMEAEVTAKIGAEAFERTADRTTYRNGFRDRRWDTRRGTLPLQQSARAVESGDSAADAGGRHLSAWRFLPAVDRHGSGRTKGRLA